ncbi:MAG TPA: tetratricopeptide repeat protein [Chthoniobacterales bacterium]|jgi:TolB-like protein|nr:tetratricopeptide repeat protein [Chthoniobacterales bacterium]
MNWRRFLGEMQRRNVYRVAVTYTVVSWVLIQIATQVFPFFGIPDWAVRLVVLLLLLGFPVALVLAWAFELTPEGFKRTEDVPRHESIRHQTGRRLLAFAAVAAAAAGALFLFQVSRGNWSGDKVETATPAGPSLSVEEKSIAVLPFSSLSADPDNAFFTDGMQDEILANLARVAALKVISRSSVAVYKAGNLRNAREIGRQLGVAHLLEGSVQRTKNRVRVTAQLVDARTDKHEWAEHYDRDLADVFAIQTEIAQAIAAQLQARLSPEERAALEPATHDVQAFDLYLRAKQLIASFHQTENWQETLLRAVRLLDEAIGRDPNFALAYCWRTSAHDSLYWYGLDRTPERLKLAQSSVQRALALAPDLGEAHLAQALVYYHGQRDYTRAFQELALARRRLPNSAEVFSLAGSIARRQGRWDDALRNLEKAFELDPRNAKIVNSLSIVYDLLRRYEEEAGVFERAAAADPGTRNYSNLLRAQIELEKADLRAVRSFLDLLPADYDPNGAATWTRLTLALYERDFEAASSVLALWKKPELIGGTGTVVPVSYWQGMIAQAKGDLAAAGSAFKSARDTIATQLAEKPDDALLLATLGVADAGVSQTSAAPDDARRALQEGARAVELRPLKEDAVDGATVLCSLALIHAWTGNIDAALDQLIFLAKTPGGPPYGQLKFDPSWDAVRKDPRFDEMLAGLEPRPKK